nr:NeuD/PglB/VioB family sugar acetyltransferase [Pseudodesulfovibrio alkaliphilus]
MIVGNGGHALVVADILACAEGMAPLGHVEKDAGSGSVAQSGLPLHGGIASLGTVPHDAVVVAIGDNRTRMAVADSLADEGEVLASAIHPSAVIARDAVIGAGCVVCAGVVVNPGCSIGRNVILNTGCTVDHHCRIGDHAHIAPGVNLAGGVSVGRGAFVGIGACAIPGVTIGEWAVVGAGAAVVRDVPSGRSVVGVPARERT